MSQKHGENGEFDSTVLPRDMLIQRQVSKMFFSFLFFIRTSLVNLVHECFFPCNFV